MSTYNMSEGNCIRMSPFVMNRTELITPKTYFQVAGNTENNESDETTKQRQQIFLFLNWIKYIIYIYTFIHDLCKAQAFQYSPAQEVGEPCTPHRRWQRRQHKPWARCMRWPEGREDWPHHTRWGRPYGSDTCEPDSCLSPSQMQVGPPSLLYLWDRKTVVLMDWKWTT